MTYVKAVLSALSAIFLTLLGFEFWFIAKEAGNSKATGLAVFGAIGLEALYSPLAWALAVLLFALLFVTGRLRSKALRILLFWTPSRALGFSPLA